MHEALPLFCEERVADLRAALPVDTVRNLMDSCIGDLRARLPILREAAGSHDASALFAEVHALSGMTASYGLLGLERRFRTIGALVQAGDIESAGHVARELPDLLVATERALAREIATQSV